MCPPDHYGIEYEINPWMDRRRQADHALACEQWLGLKSVLEKLGAESHIVEPAAGLPDMVFTANAGLVFKDRLILSRFRHSQRNGEEVRFRDWFESHGFQVELPPAGAFFEGAGDALFCGDTLFAGYRMRSDVLALQRIGHSLNCRVLPLELVDPFYYHLDTCFCPLASDLAIYFPPAFDPYARRALAESVGRLIEVQAPEAERFACNAVVLSGSVVLNTGCPHLGGELQGLGYDVRETPLGEFVKAGGSAKCLTLRLDGEDAAAWREDRH
jgi:N-dimethylarginine dimethylaminohydrolase